MLETVKEHSRFRGWFLNTWLRMKTPGVRDVFRKINEDAAELSMDDLADASRRRRLV